MFKGLKYSVAFTNGRSIGNSLEFGSGVTIITGPNGSGKSMVLEMMSFSLFGVQALRGKTSDYQAARAIALVVLRGEEFTIDRTLKNCQVLDSRGTKLVSGVKGCNEWITTRLGFGYNVYKMTSICSQGELEALGNMTPGERKAIVDETVGLNKLDALTAICSDSLSTVKTTIKVRKTMTVEPVPPTMPGNYRPMATVKAELEAINTQMGQYHSAMTTASQVIRPVVEPVDPAPMYSLEALGQHQTERLRISNTLHGIWIKLKSLPEVTLSEAQLQECLQRMELYNNYKAAHAELAGISDPGITREQLNTLKSDCEKQSKAYHNWRRYQEIKRGMVECPKCRYGFHPHAPDWDEVKNAVECGPPSAYPADIARLEAQVTQWERSGPIREKWERILKVSFPFSPIPAPLNINDRQIHLAKAGLAAVAEVEALKIQKAELERIYGGMEDLSGLLDVKQKYLNARDRYTQELEWYKERVAQVTKAQEFIQANKTLPDTQKMLVEELRTTANYETAVAEYQRKQLDYLKQLQLISDLEATAEEWSRAKTAVGNIKSRIKGFLLPSLNRTASILISTMTGGARTSIVVGEDFSILVDGSPLYTMEGSGKAVANLAVRLALSLVLTNRVFSVFGGDELDGSMDAERAENTITALTNMTRYISQVFVVTHKRFSGYPEVCLG